jgi:hypothetical protein
MTIRKDVRIVWRRIRPRHVMNNEKMILKNGPDYVWYPDPGVQQPEHLLYQAPCEVRVVDTNLKGY